jgi:hypothetical protein
MYIKWLSVRFANTVNGFNGRDLARGGVWWIHTLRNADERGPYKTSEEKNNKGYCTTK